tara:strand:+ start:589 stop:1452 length:864 start_codon:yes stop_codon:yes gene_type:complete
MAKKIKHSKLKNTGVLFELLVRQMTSDTLAGSENSPALKIIKEFFGKNTTIKKELALYNSLLKEKFQTKYRCERFIDAVLTERSKLSNPTIKRQKYNIIKEIQKKYDLREFFRTKISNYKINASIYKLFEAHTNKGINNPKEVIFSRDTVLEHVSKELKINSGEKLIKEYSKQDKSIRLLGYKILLEKFNSKYGQELNLKQVGLLKQYINNISDTKSLMEYVNKEAKSSRANILTFANRINDRITSIKLKEVSNQLKKIEKAKTIKESYLTTMMNVFELMAECKKCQ